MRLPNHKIMKKNILIIILTVLVITVLGGFLRFYQITKNPPSLTGDEISFGYSAYSILKTGCDEYGKFLPLVFKSVGDYKNPLPAYLMVASIKLFGLTDFAVRFPNALAGTLSIPVFFLFLKSIFKSKKIAIIGSFMLAISAWHIFYSRFAYETLTASLFILLGIWFFIKMIEGKTIWAFLSAFFFTLTMYTAFAPRLFIPTFVLCALIINFKRLKTQREKLLAFIGTCLVLGAPLLYITLFQGASTRLQMVFLSNDIEFSRYVLLKYFNSISDLPLLFFFWTKRYLGYFNPRFIFFNGLDATIQSPIGLGMLYVFEIPFFVMGIIAFIKNKIPHKSLFIAWALIGILPDSLTNNQRHAGRLLHIFPILIMFSTLGVFEIYKLISKIKKSFIRFTVLIGYGFFILIVLVHTFLIIAADFPKDKGESFDEGWRETVLYIQNHQDKYKEIVIDPRRGVNGSIMVSNPFLYVLFYTKYDPHTYQTENKVNHGVNETTYFKFGKYTFRQINWQDDIKQKGILFVGSPWSFTTGDMGNNKLLETIYISKGEPAFYIISSK